MMKTKVEIKAWDQHGDLDLIMSAEDDEVDYLHLEHDQGEITVPRHEFVNAIQYLEKENGLQINKNQQEG